MPYKFSFTDVPLYFGCSPTRGIVDAESSTQLNLYLNPKLLSWIFDCLQTDCSLMVMFSSSLGVVLFLFLKHMDIFNTQDVLFNIAFPYTALNVLIPHVACRDFLFFFPEEKCYSVEFICTSGSLRQDRWNYEALERHTFASK